MRKAILICRLYKSVWNVFVFARLQTFMIVDCILIGLVNEHSFRKSGFIWKVATSWSGWNYFGRKDEGAFALVGWLVGTPSHPPPLPHSLSSVGQTQIRFLVPKFGLEIWPIFTSEFYAAQKGRESNYYGSFIPSLRVMQFWMGKGDYYVTFTKNSKSTKNECFVCRYSFHCDNITKANHPPSRFIFLKIIDFSFSEGSFACVNFYNFAIISSKPFMATFRQWVGEGRRRGGVRMNLWQ